MDARPRSSAAVEDRQITRLSGAIHFGLGEALEHRSQAAIRFDLGLQPFRRRTKGRFGICLPGRAANRNGMTMVRPTAVNWMDPISNAHSAYPKGFISCHYTS